MLPLIIAAAGIFVVVMIALLAVFLFLNPWVVVALAGITAFVVVFKGSKRIQKKLN